MPSLYISNSNSSSRDLKIKGCCIIRCDHSRSSNGCCSCNRRRCCKSLDLENTSKLRLALLFTYFIGICEGLAFPTFVIYWIYTNYEWKNLPTTIYIGFLLTSAGFELTVLIGFGYLCCGYYNKANNNKVQKMCSYCNILKFILIIAGSIKTIISIQTEEFTIDNQDKGQNILVKNVRQFYSINEEIPQWIHDIQSSKKCCGIFGPSDWKEFIYPLDKSAIEDVPESCCIKSAIGCNQVLVKIDLFNQTEGGSELSEWIYTKGCRQALIDQHQLAVDYITYCLVVCILFCVVLGILYWVDCINGPEEEIEIIDDDSNSASDVDEESSANSKGSQSKSESRLKTEEQEVRTEEAYNNNDPIIKQSTNKFRQRMLASYDRDPEMCNITSLDHFGKQQQKWLPRGILKKTSFYMNDPAQTLPPIIEDISTSERQNCCEDDDKLTDDDNEDYLLNKEISKLPTRNLK